jgi:iron complex transport system permease protein
MQRQLLLVILSILACLSLFIAIFKGSTLLSLQQLFVALFGHGSAITQQIIWQLRIPRALAAFTAGSLLATAGALMQVLVRNPLADPYILGVSGGAALGALLAILMSWSNYLITVSAWLGSLFAIYLVLSLSRDALRGWSENFLLTGIAVSSGFAALMTAILFLSSPTALRSMYFWLLGDLSYATQPILPAIILFFGLIYLLALAPRLNILVKNPLDATALGLNISNLKLQIYLISALFTAAAVTLTGCLGFIGLIVPHIIRRVCGYDHRYLIPASALLGGSFLTLADTLARTILAPQQIPVGIIMSLVGIPVFLVILKKRDQHL